MTEMYTVKYNGQTVTQVPAAAIEFYATVLEEGTDYTIDESTKTITLTESGYQKGASMSFDDEDD